MAKSVAKCATRVSRYNTYETCVDLMEFVSGLRKSEILYTRGPVAFYQEGPRTQQLCRYIW